MNSTRLPKKAIADLGGRPTIQYLIERLKKSTEADEIILCTTEFEEDNILCEIAEKSGIKYFRGSSEDKLLRWHGACQKYNVEFFVNVDGDDLFFDVGLADLCLKQGKESSTPIDFIDGRGLYNDVYGISYSSLDVVCKTKKDKDTEFIRPHFINPPDRFSTQKIKDVPEKYKKQNIRMTLDYEEDLLFFRNVVNHFNISCEEMSFENILHYLNSNPDVVQINWFREEEWKNNQIKMINRVIL